MTERSAENQSILSSSVVMAAGTIVSRLSGYVRTVLLAAALGNLLHADIFMIGNTIPNMLYILLAGGVLNAVLVPQLVRAMKNDPDGGEAYTNRVVTLLGLFLGTVTILLVVAAPWVMRIFLPADFYLPENSEQLSSAVNFARYCLPQVFFYGMFVLVGQILNARGRFGPMMWAPIANNVISVLVLVGYLLVFGPARGAERFGGYSTAQELVLGVGSTLGIVAQFLVLLPYLRAAGFHFRPRFDFRGTGLGHTLRLGSWTLGFVLVNQIAYAVVVRLAASGTAEAATGAGSPTEGTGYAVYSAAFLIMMVPHSVVTVSLATAILPRLSAKAAGGDLAGLAATLAGTLRTALVLIIPFAALLPLIAIDLANVILGYGAARDTYELYALSLGLFGPGLVFFTVHYLMLRGFYSLEQTRTAFMVQTAIAATNIGVAVLLVTNARAVLTAPALVVAYIAAYVVGSAVSYAVLRRRLGGLETPRLLRFLARMAVAVPAATAAAWGVSHLIRANVEEPSQLVGGLSALTITTVDVVVFVVLARLLRIIEVTSVVGLVSQRLRSSRQGSRRTS